MSAYMRLKDKNVVRLGTNKPKIFGANRVKFRIACTEFRRMGVSDASSVVHGFFPVWTPVNDQAIQGLYKCTYKSCTVPLGPFLSYFSFSNKINYHQPHKSKLINTKH